MSSADEVHVPAARRRSLPWAAMLVVVAVAAAVVASAALLPPRWRAVDHRLIEMVRLPPLLALVGLVALGMAAALLRARALRTLPVVGAEEPVVAAPSLPAIMDRAQVVTLFGLTPGCGVSTLAFNLAVSLAVHGEARSGDTRQPVRPACLLAEGRLSTALGLKPDRLEEHLARPPWEVKPEVVNLAAAHPSGCALFCLKPRDEPADSVHRLLAELRRQYDAVLVDGAAAGGRLTAVDAWHSDLFLLVGLPARSSVEPAGRWIERVWGMGLENRTALVLNRVPAWPPPRELLLAFYYLVLLPEEPRVRALDQRGVPWSLDDRLAMAERLADVGRQLFPAFAEGGGRHAA